jgi:hypothetical protein
VIHTQVCRPGSVAGYIYRCLPLGASTLGPIQVRFVGRFAQAELTHAFFVQVAKRADWNTVKIVRLDLQRRQKETFGLDCKGSLGFNTSRVLSAKVIGRHQCLVFVASSLSPLTSLPSVLEGMQGIIPTSGDACRQQGRALLQQLLVFVHDQLSHGARIK